MKGSRKKLLSTMKSVMLMREELASTSNNWLGCKRTILHSVKRALHNRTENLLLGDLRRGVACTRVQVPFNSQGGVPLLQAKNVLSLLQMAYNHESFT